MSHDKLAELLSAYLDGEVDVREREYVEREIARDETARAMLEDLRQMREMTAKLPRQGAPDSMANDVLRQLERQALLGDTDESPYPMRTSWRPMRAMMSLAAAMAILVTGGWWYMRGADQGVTNGESQLAMVTQKQDDFSAEKDAVKPGDRRIARARKSSPAKSRLAKRSQPVAVMDAAPPAAKPALERDNRPALKEAAESLVIQADTEQRLAAGEKLDFLATHAFKNEPVRLRLAMHDAKQIAQAREAFKLQLASQGLVNADAIEASTQATKLRGQSFYYQGKAGTNYRGDNQSQMLVRIPIGQMQTLLDNIDIEGVKDKDVALSAGPIVVQGLAQAQSSVSHFRQSATEAVKLDMDAVDSSTKNEVTKSKKAGEAKESQVDIFAEMMKAVGLSQDMLTFSEAAPMDTAQAKKESNHQTRNEVVGLAKGADDERDDATVLASVDRTEEAGVEASGSRPLVERRKAALRKSRKRRRMARGQRVMADKAHPAAKATLGQGKKAEQQYITLVVEFVAPPKKKRTRVKPPAGAKSKSSKPVKAKAKKSEHPLQ